MVGGAKEQLERHARKRKELAEHQPYPNSPRRSTSTERQPSPLPRTPSGLDNVPEAESTFTIGDDDDDSDEEHTSRNGSVTPMGSTMTSEPQSMVESEPSRAASLSSPIDDAVPTQLGGMSEKARGKLPVSQRSFSRTSSTSSLSNALLASALATGTFEPNEHWVCNDTFLSPLYTEFLTFLSRLTAGSEICLFNLY